MLFSSLEILLTPTRNEEIFGESPHSFDPERWIKGVVKGEGDEKVPSIGAYASAYV